MKRLRAAFARLRRGKPSEAARANLFLNWINAFIDILSFLPARVQLHHAPEKSRKNRRVSSLRPNSGQLRPRSCPESRWSSKQKFRWNFSSLIKRQSALGPE